ncbi:unnamed protein product [Symbiodinium necroappetens]|uniref:Uncharacterized protein n=1 Tax=Symbiodinium necroappetens TaxID=1628268 RepID=A0A812PUC3_9DINO|nr:unnamed protein product [Symbiodinium necroappetens]
MVAAACLAAIACTSLKVRRLLECLSVALLFAHVFLTCGMLLALSTWCCVWMRPWIAQVLFVTTGGEAAIWPHHLEVLPGPAGGCFSLAGLLSFAAGLLLIGGQGTVDAANIQIAAEVLEPKPHEPERPRPSQDKLLQLVVQRRGDIVRKQRRWADTLLVGCAGCFALLLLSSLWIVGQKAVDLGVKDALNKPTWRRGRHPGGVPWRSEDYREAWRDVKAASICTGIRTAIKIDDFRKSVQQHADETAQQLKKRFRSARVYSNWSAVWSCTNRGTASTEVNPACFTVQLMFHLVAGVALHWTELACSRNAYWIGKRQQTWLSSRRLTFLPPWCKDLRRNISMLIKEEVSELETTVELGCQFFVKALIPDTSCILVDVGLNFRLEMPLADAEAFLEDKETHLRSGLELKSKQVARVKAGRVLT